MTTAGRGAGRGVECSILIDPDGGGVTSSTEETPAPTPAPPPPTAAPPAPPPATKPPAPSAPTPTPAAPAPVPDPPPTTTSSNALCAAGAGACLSAGSGDCGSALAAAGLLLDPAAGSEDSGGPIPKGIPGPVPPTEEIETPSGEVIKTVKTLFFKVFVIPDDACLAKPANATGEDAGKTWSRGGRGSGSGLCCVLAGNGGAKAKHQWGGR